jgi:hypothetical protein
MTYEADPGVDANIDPLPPWQQEICREVREIVHDADPEVEGSANATMMPSGPRT